MPARAVALLSGGLDSMLAIRLLQDQGIEVEALNFHTTFTCCQDQAARAADELGVRLSVVTEQDDYLEVVRNPRHGYGRGANPCVDCRIYMFRIAARFMRDTGADLVASGEVVGQRPMSQKKRDLAVIAKRAGLDDHLLRPLSARLLPVTAPERNGLVKRDKLLAISGRGRSELIALAREFGLARIPQPSSGCALTDPKFGAKVHDLLNHDRAADRWQFELLKIGRHIRFDRLTKVVLGRRAEENDELERQFERQAPPQSVLIVPDDFQGPTALIVGSTNETAIEFGMGLVRQYAKLPADRPAGVVVRRGSEDSIRELPTTVAAMPSVTAI